jgi:hypothetical protein
MSVLVGAEKRGEAGVGIEARPHNQSSEPLRAMSAAASQSPISAQSSILDGMMS